MILVDFWNEEAVFMQIQMMIFGKRGRCCVSNEEYSSRRQRVLWSNHATLTLIPSEVNSFLYAHGASGRGRLVIAVMCILFEEHRNAHEWVEMWF